jgi:hypothetical protein
MDGFVKVILWAGIVFAFVLLIGARYIADKQFENFSIGCFFIFAASFFLYAGVIIVGKSFSLWG